MYGRQIIKSVTRSLTKLGQTARPALGISPARNARIKTLERESSFDIVGIEHDLELLGYSREFLHTLFVLKCEDNQIKPNDAKYGVFLSALLKKLKNCNKLVVLDHNLKDKSLKHLLEHINGISSIVSLDLSNHRVSSLEALLKVLNKHPRIIEVALRNMNLQAEDIKAVFDSVIAREQIVSLDISNHSSDWLNRLSDSTVLLERLVTKARTLMILQLEGLNIRDKGVEALERGYKSGATLSLLYLNLKNNNLTRHSFPSLKTILLKGSIKELNLSDNNLSDEGIEQLGELKSTQLTKLDLSNVGMESRGLIAFLERLRDSKELETLILDHNDFSNNWFIRIHQVICDNKSLKELRLAECRIKYLESLFDGLTDNASLLKLNVSRNGFDNKYEELMECLVRNETLKELKLKSCGIDEFGIKKVAKALQVNRTLRVLDLSENSIGSEAGKQLLSSLYLNNHIISLSLERTQVELATRKFIEEKVEINQVEYGKRQRQMLMRQNNLVKQKDRERKENLQSLKETVETSKQYIQDLKNLVEVLTNKLAATKKRHQETINACEGQMANLNKQLMKLQVDNRPVLNSAEYSVGQLNEKIEQARQKKQQQIRNVKKLDAFLIAERQRIRKIEDTLEQQFENQKYLRKKQSVSLPRLSKEDSSPAKRSRVVEIRTASKVELKTK